MRTQILQITADKIYYKNNIYNFYGNWIKSIKNMGIIILNEDLYSKVVPINKGKRISNNEIREVIKESFGEDEDYLFHYFIDKKISFKKSSKIKA